MKISSTDFGGALDQLYPWVDSNNSFISKKNVLGTLFEMCSMNFGGAFGPILSMGSL